MPLILALLVLCLLPATASAALPLQGGWEHCNLAENMGYCEQRLDSIAQAGFGAIVVGSPGNYSPEVVERYAAAARERGLKIIWSMSNEGWWEQPEDGDAMLKQYTHLAQRCECQTNQQLLEYIVRWLEGTGVTYGYYIVDDLQVREGDPWPGIKRYSERINAIDPEAETIMGTWGLTMTHMLTSAAQVLDLPAHEVYPIYGPDAASNLDSVQSLSRESARVTQRVMDEAGKPSAFILQAFSWGDNLWDARASGHCPQGSSAEACPPSVARYPSRQELKIMRDAALLQANPKLILYYNLYASLGWDPHVKWGEDQRMPDAMEQARRWSDLKAVVSSPEPTTRGQIKGPRRVRSGREVRLRVKGQFRGGLKTVNWKTPGARQLEPCAKTCYVRYRKPGLYRVSATAKAAVGPALELSRGIRATSAKRARR